MAPTVAISELDFIAITEVMKFTMLTVPTSWLLEVVSKFKATVSGVG